MRWTMHYAVLLFTLCLVTIFAARLLVFTRVMIFIYVIYLFWSGAAQEVFMAAHYRITIYYR
jgi:hypothetical protein